MAIRDALPPFQYGRKEDEENEPGVIKEKRPMVTLPDGAKYEGEWNKLTNKKHGRGY